MKVNYFKQENKYTCSLAILRMVLDYNGIKVSENELIKKVEAEYGSDFKNIYNPTIAKLACSYGIKTDFYALWPLLRKTNFSNAFNKYLNTSIVSGAQFDENPYDNDRLGGKLSIAYRDMFEAVKLGCRVHYGGITANRINETLDGKRFIQLSIKVHLIYPGLRHVYHSILLFKEKDGIVTYHDPAHGEGLQADVKKIINATEDVRAYMVFNNGGG